LTEGDSTRVEIPRDCDSQHPANRAKVSQLELRVQVFLHPIDPLLRVSGDGAVVHMSSERAFSAAGIAVSKRRNWLKPDIVEAPQRLKGMFRSDLMFREYLVSAHAEGIQEETGGKADETAALGDLDFDLAGDSDCDVDIYVPCE
jgi:hypothetical protein